MGIPAREEVVGATLGWRCPIIYLSIDPPSDLRLGVIWQWPTPAAGMPGYENRRGPPISWIPASAGMTGLARVAGTKRGTSPRATGLAGARERDGHGLFSYQSLMPAGAGTPRYEN